jgi:hypothetical protein
LIARVIKCRRTLELAGRIIDGSNEQEEVIGYFPGDSLFTPFERRRGMPIGNQTSQFFANVYLNPLDHFLMRELRPGLYLRYVDDFVLFSDDKRELGFMAERIREFLQGLRLSPHERKFRIYRCDEGVTLLGWRMLPGQARLARSNVVRMRRRLKKMAALYHAGRLRFEEVQCRLRAWIGHAAFGDTRRLRQNLFVYSKGSGTRPKCAGARGTTILRTSASRTVTGTSQRTGTTTSGFVVPGMRSAASVVLGPAGGNRFHLRRLRECQLRFRAVDPDAHVSGVKQQADPGFLVALEANVNPGLAQSWPPRNMKTRSGRR